MVTSARNSQLRPLQSPRPLTAFSLTASSADRFLADRFFAALKEFSAEAAPIAKTADRFLADRFIS
jgi:hypothetical protein